MAADGEIGQSWEELEDSGELDKRIQQITILKRGDIENKGDGRSAGVVLQEENQRTAYQPTVKILKRQPNNPENTPNVGLISSTAAASAQTQKKTLEQREAEYAEARMRIFGAASSSPEEQNGSVPERPERLLQRVDELRVSDNVIRQPRGPDPSGNKGFTHHR